jgi:hypothetical protein
LMIAQLSPDSGLLTSRLPLCERKRVSVFRHDYLWFSIFSFEPTPKKQKELLGSSKIVPLGKVKRRV